MPCQQKKKAFKTTKGVNLHWFLGDVLYPVLQLTDAIRRWARHKGLKIDLLRNLLEWTGEPDNDPRARLSRISDPRATFCYCCIAIGCIYQRLVESTNGSDFLQAIDQ